MTGSAPFRGKKNRKGGTGRADGAHSPTEAPADLAALSGKRHATDETQGPATVSPARIEANVERGRTASLAAALGRGARKGGAGARAGLGAVADRIMENAPRIPVRDLATLRGQFPGLGPEQIADKLVAGASKSSATVGAGIGAAAMLPVPPAMPAEMAAEIVGVASIEFKLIAELHEVYGIRAPGTVRQRAAAYLGAWADERGIQVTKPASVNAALGGQMKRELRQQILKRTFRNLPMLTPFMVGAAVGAAMNRRDTKRIAEKVRKDLRARQVPWDALDITVERADAGAAEIEKKTGKKSEHKSGKHFGTKPGEIGD
ncbi:hypothetical protein [Streptomyces sp. H27-D2]|uniref:hypothetical protein n=1 Tax=Streptomyces sp. H27-D2 TaxID=3046304 RepID=UPI002DB61DA9|nr:hypothetical protein [Streptomyces sp. H27-D2]MEC4016628.1 hypothetical protein [Streptomyces sp. H27-D2]